MSIKFVIFASLLQTTRAWYLAYNAEEFSANDSIPLYTNKIFSDKTQLNFAYTELPFVCKPKAVNHKLLNLGEVLRGDRIAESDLELRVGQNVTCKILCGTDLLPLTDLRFARSLVTLDYKVEWIVDDLPAANLRHFQVGDSSKILQSYDTGFSLGSLLEKGNTVLLNNHFDLTILYSDEGKKNKFYIVGFEIKTKRFEMINPV